jgi:hypothetical protein
LAGDFGSLWIPGTLLFGVVAYLVSVGATSNPEFFRVFIEHNLAVSVRPLSPSAAFWFYLPVVAGLMPGRWLILAVTRARLLWSERKEAMATAEDSGNCFC